MSNVRLAHILLVHKHPEQVNAFVRQLAGDGNADVYIHVDAKCEDAMVRAIHAGGCVSLLEERVPVAWGDFSVIEATLRLLRAVRASGKTYDFITLNSGQDLLIRHGLREHLAANRDRVFLSAKRIEPADPENNAWKIRWPRVTRNLYDSPFHPYRLLRAALVRCYRWNLNLRPNPLALPEGWSFYRDAQWFCVPGGVADYILDYLDQHPDYCRLFQDALAPDEFFFTTLIMNSPYAAQVTGAHLTHLNFGKSLRDKNHPVVATMDDIPSMEDSGRFFARKFDQSLDGNAIRYFCEKYGHPNPGSKPLGDSDLFQAPSR
jgi:hypothetical protein